jgi:hypothetical protein
MRPRRDNAKGQLRPQRKVDDMTGKQKHTEAERDGTGKIMHKRAVEEEAKWRPAHGVDDKLRTKHQTKAKIEHPPLDRGEVRRRENRQQERADRTLLARPLLVAAKDDDGPRLIKASDMPAPRPKPSQSAEPPSSGYGVEPKGKRGKAVRRMIRNGTLPP